MEPSIKRSIASGSISNNKGVFMVQEDNLHLNESNPAAVGF